MMGNADVGKWWFWSGLPGYECWCDLMHVFHAQARMVIVHSYVTVYQGTNSSKLFQESMNFLNPKWVMINHNSWGFRSKDSVKKYSYRVSSVQNLCWLMIIVDYTTLHIIGVTSLSNRGTPKKAKQDSMEWDLGILNTAHVPIDHPRRRSMTLYPPCTNVPW